MKRVLGLDLGTNSVGWALVNEAENDTEVSSIVKLGVRVNPLTADEKKDFENGNPLSTNANRTLKRGARRNLQRYKLRRENLIKLLLENKIISKDTVLTEVGKNTTHETLSIRARSASEKIELNDFAKVLLAINKKRGYRSSRKAKNEEEGQAIDGMAIAKELYDRGLTPGQYVLELLLNNKKYIPDFYRSDLKAEFDAVWNYQQQFYPDILDNELYLKLEGQGQQNSRKRFLAIKEIYTAENKGKRDEVKLQHYQWRSDALTKQLSIEEVAYVLVEINNNLNQSSGYLGAISDRSKKLYFNNITVGEYLYEQIKKNPHTSLKNQVFYRQDYLDEFETVWEEQAKHHKELTAELKEKIRDVVIFYQRKLKSQKGQLSYCQFESWEQEYVDKLDNKKKKRTVGYKVAPKSSPLFQEAKIWQKLNTLIIINKNDDTVYEIDEDSRVLLFNELNVRGNLKETEVLKLFGLKSKDFKTNYPTGLDGNVTNAALFNIYQTIADNEGYVHDWSKKKATDIVTELKTIFPVIGISPEILDFDATLKKNDFEQQLSYQFWHLLYSAEDDDKIKEEDKLVYGNSSVSLKKKLHLKYGFKPEYASLIANISLVQDYGNLSSKALKKIMPYLKDGNIYSEACGLAGYNHSNSETKEDLAKKVYKNSLELLKKNSLRNPVVEKILNQMVNVINQIVEEYGKPDEVRIELARELKKTADERGKMTKSIREATARNEEVKNIIRSKFGIPNPTKTDVTRYRLWQELEHRGHKTLFTNQYIRPEILFSKEIDIEHIIPKALLFDDSFSNKTLAFREVNLKKRDRTAIDFIESEYNSYLEEYKIRVEDLFKANIISKGKRNKLLMSASELKGGFIERDLRNTQYIAKKAKNMLKEVFPTVIATIGSITDKLREDWDLINVMKELNLPKYRALCLTEYEERLNKQTGELVKYEVIKDWTKRNDHRHHAMDALAVAFTTYNHVNYINNLNASRSEESELYGVRNKITYKDGTKRKFVAPMPNFRTEAKKHIESILISFKAKNKVVTRNVNKTKKSGKDNYNKVVQLTPRGQLHKETVYGQSLRKMKKATKLNNKITLEQINLIINHNEKKVVLDYLSNYNNDIKTAFDTKNLKKNPLEYKGEPLKEVFCFEKIYTIRKEISPDLKIDKVVDDGIKEILKARLDEFDNKPKLAFSDLDKNPIWLNKEKGISIKRVTITGVSSVEALHHKKDHFGNDILDENGKVMPTDFVSTGNNHHVAIYQDSKGDLHENVVSFYEAVARVKAGLDIVDKEFNKDKGWKFKFSLKQNEMFIIPNDEVNFDEIDLEDGVNSSIISGCLFRVQKIGSKDYWFRHHLETVVTNDLVFTYKRFRTPGAIRNIKKVRINHIGKIVQVGEY